MAKPMIVDAHTHVWKTGERPASVTDLTASLRAAEVRTALVIEGEPAFPDVLPSLPDLLSTLEPYSNLFVIASVRPSDADPGTLRKLEAAVSSGKVRGFKCYLGYEHFFPNDGRLRPIYELAARLEVPIVFHTGFLWDPKNRGSLKYAHPLGVDDVAVDFPSLKIIIAHMGNPWIRDCALVIQKNPNVYADVSGYFSDFVSPFQSEERNAFLNDLTTFRNIAGSYQKLLFGTDWPLCDIREYVSVAHSIPMNDEEREFFFWKNAVALFNLPTIPGVS